MLRLEEIKKSYQTGNTSFPALKGISLAFRKNEFVSILGPSGCGKTTLLNIIGGLDHYTSGDLVIEGKSTKEYTSHDWDIYRNHRIGFIFQSYNLIPHQTILENVELALTIAGYSKEEKRKKALAALEEVGLKDAYKKLPNQLSGGQCQRVAIARALVNEPDILLGDEPTGALDSKTSVQVMELIKKISKKKLVIMVTHNPPLAEQYSTRIISLLDGEVQNDTNPYSLEEEAKEERKEVTEVKVGDSTVVKPNKAKMSFWSAFKLSAKNLISKRKRTIMVIAASSIGIVGVSAVLAVSTGVRGYINNMENDMLSGNPVRASETSLDIASVISNLSNLVRGQSVSKAWRDGYIDIEYLTKLLIENGKSGSIITNDIDDYYVEYVKEMDKKYLADAFVNYGMSFANNIYTISSVEEQDKSYYHPEAGEDFKVAYSLSGLKNVYTALLASLKDEKHPETSFVPLANIAANFPSVIYQGLDNNDYIRSQYDIIQGDLPKEDATNECVVVLNRRNKLADLIVALSGMMSEKDFMKAIWQFIDEKPSYEQIIKQLKLDDLLKQKLFYVPNDIVDIESGNEVRKEGAFRENSSAIGSITRPYEYNYKFKYEEKDGKKYLSRKIGDDDPYSIEIKNTDNNIREIKIVGIIKPKEGKNYGSLSSGIYFRSPLANQIMEESAKSNIITQYMNPPDPVDPEEKIVQHANFENYIFIPNDSEEASHNIGLTYDINFMTVNKEGDRTTIVNTYGSVGSSNLIIEDYDDPFVEPTSPERKKGTLITSSLSSRALAGLKAVEIKTPSSKRKYDFKKVPYTISIYNTNFDNKKAGLQYLDRWNSTDDITINNPYKPGEKITLKGVGVTPGTGEIARTRITYTDNLTIVVLMINNLINITTISLTVFASLSLVVSTVMIGIITYISVMERIKEIGVIRSLGGRKKDVSHLFNAETFILGGLSGLFGIIITYIFQIILDVIIYNVYKIPNIANLKWWTALIMIALSIVLTAVSGLIPARSAAKKDPVNALRSE